jgi:transcriptional regulator with XRE-family HTH domain
MADAEDAHGSISVPFGPGLEELMRDGRLSYRAMAERTGLSAGYLNHLTRGNRPVPSNRVIERIADALDVPADRFREYRLRRISTALERDPALVDRVYRELVVRASSDGGAGRP